MQALDGQITIIIVQPGNDSEPTACPVRLPCPAQMDMAASGVMQLRTMSGCTDSLNNLCEALRCRRHWTCSIVDRFSVFSDE
jgi:hypothetical protein